MCQAFAAEQQFVMSCERASREEGYKAFHDGKTEDDCPPEEFLFYPDSWRVGFHLAKTGQKLF